MTDEELLALQSTGVFKSAYDVVKPIGGYFQITVSFDEVGYFTEHILGSGILSSAVDEKTSRTELDTLVCNLIAEVSCHLKQDLTLDRHLFHGLLNELRPYLYRLKYGLASEFGSESEEEIKHKYKDLFDMVRNSVRAIEKYTNGILTDSTVAHLTLHFGAALERLNPQDKSLPHVLVVCAAGLGTANLLASKIQAVFDVCIVGIVACHQAGRALGEQHVDLVVSTVDIKDTAVPAVTVNPLLPPHDLALLKTYLGNGKFAHRLIDSTLRIVARHCVIKDYERLYSELTAQFGAAMERKENSCRPSLRELLTVDMMELDVEVKDWKEAVRQAGALLYHRRIIEETYIQAMIDVVEKLGPYIVLWPGVALPHASTDKGVHRVGISFVRLKYPVPFGPPDKDPVKLIFALAAVDTSSHVMALLELTRMLSDCEKVKVLSRLPDNRQVEEFIALNLERAPV